MLQVAAIKSGPLRAMVHFVANRRRPSHRLHLQHAYVIKLDTFARVTSRSHSSSVALSTCIGSAVACSRSPDALQSHGDECMKDRKLYTIDETRQLLGGISRTTIYLLIGRRKLASVEIGRRRFISAEAISDFIDASASITAPPDKPARPGNGPRQRERLESVGLRGSRERSGR